MYEILLFSGGVYKFELLREHVDDIGGLIIQEDRLHISRGSSFLSEEIRVMLIVPPNEISSLKSLANDIKGQIEELELEEKLKNNLIYSLKIYDVLCKESDWLNKEALIKIIESSHENGVMEKNLTEQDIFTEESFEECLELMLSLKLITKRGNDENKEVEYRISEDK